MFSFVFRHTTAWDRIILISQVVVAVCLMFVLPRWVLSGANDVEIMCGETLVGRYPLSEDRVIEVNGKLGVTVVRIKDRSAWIESSPCSNKICVHMGDVGPNGGVVVCVPNEVVLRVPADRQDGLDAVAR